ncbi:hypothetical protein BVRB_1g022170 [Beta vulgaris subsp. vulgaris]|nr:hypothetical protein BVRB_1g022170 [Beta vulgaris subsp. vulgaris]
MDFSPLTQISECFIKPKHEVEESKQPYHLSPFDILLLSGHYLQKGLLFTKPKQDVLSISSSIDKLLESLKHSLALTLVHFYPLAGQLNTIVDNDHGRSLVYVDCNKGPGVRFVHATLDNTTSDIISPGRVPAAVNSFFDHRHGEVNYDGHTRPLLSIQVTELIDGIFIGCSMNHAIVDGTSFWHFWNVWSDIHRANNAVITRLPIHKRWFPDGYSSKDMYLPFIDHKEFIYRYDPPQLVGRFFHFSMETITNLKARANEEIGNTNKVSSFQALIAFVWRSIIQAKGLNPNQLTHCKLAANNRTRLEPPLPEEYFGNLLSILVSTTTVGELLEQSFGKTALSLRQLVVNHTNKDVHNFAHSWFKSPFSARFDRLLDKEPNSTLHVGSSPRFNIYGNEFAGIGKPIAVRSGVANKFDGKLNLYPGNEGGGSVDVEICLPCDSMRALEANEDFMAVVSSPK